MDVAAWRTIEGYFPASYPPTSEMLGLSLSSRSRVCVVPIGVVNTGDEPLLRYAVPEGTIPMSRVKPRTGPIFFRQAVQCRVSGPCSCHAAYQYQGHRVRLGQE